jgi:hypothetical protein
MRCTLRRTVVLALTLFTIAAGATPVGVASAATSPTVSDNPADFTPNVVDAVGGSNGTVLKYQQVGTTMYAVGRIGLVQDATRTLSYQRHNVFAFNAKTGEVLPWAPVLDGPATAMVASPDGRYLYVGGKFRRVNGRLTRGLVKFSVASGRVVRKFSCTPAGQVNDLAWVNNQLLVGGSFRRGLRSISPRTGHVTKWLTVRLSGATATQTHTKAYRFAVNPARTRLVVVGNFTRANVNRRRQAVMIRLDGRGGRVTSWRPRTFRKTCSTGSAWARGVDFSPSGRFFVIVTSGGAKRRTICDSISRWSTTGRGHAHPTWVNYTGSDSVYSVEVTRTAVYVGGHFRWLDNRNVSWQARGNAVERLGIGALHPTTGRALAWNPGKTRAHGAEELYRTAAGLWIGSDGRYVKGEWREGIAFMPAS